MLYQAGLWIELAAVPITLVVLFVVTAPYGRHGKPGWGPTVSSRLGWVLMEGTSAFVFAAIYFCGERRLEIIPLVFLTAWLVHYLYRSVIYPNLTRSTGRKMPVLIVASGMGFNTLNAWLNARWVSHIGRYELSWVKDPRFIAGLVLMAAGLFIHTYSDILLIRLRKPGDKHYSIPNRGLHRWLCNPNYLGEIIEWTGWALATWSIAGLAFALFTAANLVPRAIANLRWYRETFEDYPIHRKALIPGIF